MKRVLFDLISILLVEIALSANPFSSILTSSLSSSNSEGTKGWQKDESKQQRLVYPKLYCADLNGDSIDDFIKDQEIYWWASTYTFYQGFWQYSFGSFGLSVPPSIYTYFYYVDSMTDYYPTLFVVGNVYNDGKNEIVVTSNDKKSISIKRLLEYGGSYFSTTNEFSSAIDLGDINGDEIDDFALAISTSSTVCIVWGRTSLWTHPLNVQTNTNKSLCISISGTNNFGLIVAKKAGDFNGDGINDIVVADNFNIWVIYGKNGTNNWISTVTSMTLEDGFKVIYSTTQLSLVYVGDMNGDKIPDILFSNSSEIGYLIFGSSDTSSFPFNSSTVLNGKNGATVILPSKIYYIAIGDINNDGCDDMAFSLTTAITYTVFGRSSNEVSWYSSIIAGTQLETNSSFGFWTQSYFSGTSYPSLSLCLGDINGDQVKDLVVYTATSVNNQLIYARYGTSWFLFCTTMNAAKTGCSKCESGYGINPINGHCQDCSLLSNHYYISNTLPCKSELFFCLFSLLTETFYETDCKDNHCLNCTLHGNCTFCDCGFEISGNAICTQCTNQQYNNPLGLKCIDCELVNGCKTCNMSNGLCTSCPNEMFINGNGCSLCPHDYWNNISSATSCNKCELGNGCLKCNSTNGDCISCPNNKMINGTGCINIQSINVTITFDQIFDSETNDLKNEIAILLGIDVSEINVVLIGSTEVFVTITDHSADSLTEKLVDIINNDLCN